MTDADVVRINTMRAATVIRQQTVEQGLDPRDFVLYAFSGAGPVHAFGYAAESGVREVVVPLGNGATTLSAYGIASGDVVLYRKLEVSLLAPFDTTALETAVARVRDAAPTELAATGVAGEPVVRVDAKMPTGDHTIKPWTPQATTYRGVTIPADGWARPSGSRGRTRRSASAAASVVRPRHKGHQRHLVSRRRRDGRASWQREPGLEGR